MIEKLLHHKGIQLVRIDGKVNQKKREAAIKSFRSDTTICIMLLSLSCGAVGYVKSFSSINSLGRFENEFC